jgi:hypothetical protein
MEKYEVEDFGIEGDGDLWIWRKGEIGKKYAACPFIEEWCGRWCPLFGEVEEDAICQIKSISLCHKTIWCRIKQDEPKDR